MSLSGSISAEHGKRSFPANRAWIRPRLLPLILYFVVFSGSIYLLFGSLDESAGAEKSGASKLYVGLLVVTYSVMFYQLFSARNAALRALAKSTTVLLFVISGAVSLIAAGALGISAMRYAILVITFSAGLVISVQYSLDEFCETFFYTAFAITIIYFLAYPILANRIVYDALERTTLLGLTSYAGLFPHKSVAGTFFSFTLMVSAIRFVESRGARYRRPSWILACLSVAALLLAGAVGRLLSLVIGTVLALLIRAWLRRDTTNLAFMTVLLLLAAVVYLVIGDAWIYFFGRNWALTGRQELFELWPRFFMEKPLFGYGFDGFFTDVAGAPGSYLADLSGGRSFSTFESVYLDLLIEFGLVGGLLYSCILLRAVGNAIGVHGTSSSKYKFLPLVTIIWVIVGSSLDSGIIHQNSLDCVLVLWIYFGVDRFNKVKSPRVPMSRELRGLRAGRI